MGGRIDGLTDNDAVDLASDSVFHRAPGGLRCLLCKNGPRRVAPHARFFGCIRSIRSTYRRSLQSGAVRTILYPPISACRVLENDVRREMVLYRVPVDGCTSFGVVHACLVDLRAPIPILEASRLAIEAYAARLSPADGIVCFGIGRSHGDAAGVDEESVMTDVYSFSCPIGADDCPAMVTSFSTASPPSIGALVPLVTPCGDGVENRIATALASLQHVATRVRGTDHIRQHSHAGGASDRAPEGTVDLLGTLWALCETLEQSRGVFGACHIAAFLAHPVRGAVVGDELQTSPAQEDLTEAAMAPLRVIMAGRVPSGPGNAFTGAAGSEGDGGRPVISEASVDQLYDQWCGDRKTGTGVAAGGADTAADDSAPHSDDKPPFIRRHGSTT